MSDRRTRSAARPTPRKPALRHDIERNVLAILGNDSRPPRRDTYYQGLAYCVRERLIRRWLEAQRHFYADRTKRVYYLSMEFLPGRFLHSYILSLGMGAECAAALRGTGLDLTTLLEEENDPGLGNGGLGRLASCYMDSLATLGIPGYGYGIRYDYGIFQQEIVNGRQREICDNWLRKGNPWEIARRNFLSTVHFGGRVEAAAGPDGTTRYRWVDTDTINAMACDILIPGYACDSVNNMRLWAAMSSTEFNLDYYNSGNYLKAMEETVLKENISKILYPSDTMEQGKVLRLKQQYFFVAATFQDIMRRVEKTCRTLDEIPQMIAVQLNDTHPTIAIAELMRLLLDSKGLDWDAAWSICQRTFAYTNHTVMPEALEKWPVTLLERLLPRHLQIIYEINRRFLDELERRYPGDGERHARMSIIEEQPVKAVRMAHLAIVGSHTVNGVAELHTEILRSCLFHDFDAFYPGKFRNITNGITQRRWLLQANPALAGLITKTIGDGWIRDLEQLRRLAPLAEDPAFCRAWRRIRQQNKRRLAAYIRSSTGIEVDPASLFDVQVKRIHEYKRQLLNLLHVITLYRRLLANPEQEMVPRTFVFAGKAAPSYRIAKLTIELINAVAAVVNPCAAVRNRLKVVFLPNYNVSQAERIVAAADLSEQISTAGLEASGTSNMKFALNGALIIGTLDGANIEIMYEVGADNLFIFGLQSAEVLQLRPHYDPWAVRRADPELDQVLQLIASGHFDADERDRFAPLLHALLDGGDRYFVLADYRAYVEAQETVSRTYRDQRAWTRKAILNTAHMGKFSSDRAVREYARDIWGLEEFAAGN